MSSSSEPPAGGSPRETAEQVVALVGGDVFVGDGSVLRNATVLTQGGRIREVAQGGGKVPRGARVLRVEGCTVLPGLIDCHTHICLDGSSDPFGRSRTDSFALRVLQAAERARRTLLAGVTTIRDMGGVDGIDLEIRNAISSGLIPGPRILASGRLICITGGHGWPIGREIDGVDEMRKAVREQLKSGADLVKFIVTGGVLTPGSDPGAQQMTREELQAGIEEAHRAGRKTAAHAKGSAGILCALQAGIDSIEHGTIMTEEAVALMAERKVGINFTLSAMYGIEHRGLQGGMGKALVDKAVGTKARRDRSIEMVRQAGIPITMGTDAGTPFNLHGDNARELELLVGVGFSPTQALVAATDAAARSLGLEQHIGSIAPGKSADLVVVEGDPLRDITVLSRGDRLKLVMKDGRPALDRCA